MSVVAAAVPVRLKFLIFRQLRWCVYISRMHFGDVKNSTFLS